MIAEIEDSVRVSPDKFSLGLKNAVKKSLMEKWEGVTDKRLGIILAVTGVKDTGEGKIYPGDGAVHYPAKFELLVYRPEQHEIVTGEVIDITEFGAFLRVGPVDAMVHVSQIMDDFVSFDHKNSMFIGKESKHKLKEGDVVRGRIISVSVTGREFKVGLTTRQPGLGALEWIEEGKKKPAAKGKEAG